LLKFGPLLASQAKASLPERDYDFRCDVNAFALRPISHHHASLAEETISSVPVQRTDRDLHMIPFMRRISRVADLH
jgi:MoxR-like ATPase